MQEGTARRARAIVLRFAAGMVNPRDEDGHERLELPPLDGEESEPKRSDFDEPLPAVADDGHDPYDDRTAEDAATDEALPTLEGESVLDDAPSDIDVDAPAMIERLAEITAAPDDDAGGFADEADGDLDEGGETLLGDRGEEGFVEPDEALSEADLPALDADEDGEAEDGLFYDDEREAPGDDLVFSERSWPVVAKVPLGDVVEVAVAGSRVDARLVSGAALRSVDGGVSFAASDAPPPSLPAPRGTSVRLPGDRVVTIRSGFERCLVVCTAEGQAPRIVCDLSMELDADASDVAVRALAYDVGTTTLWIACRWGVVGLEVPREHIRTDVKSTVS